MVGDHCRPLTTTLPDILKFSLAVAMVTISDGYLFLSKYHQLAGYSMMYKTTVYILSIFI